MAVPKRKTSKARRDKRRNNLWKLTAPTLVRCSNCGEYKRPHRLCSACGHYDGREVVKVGELFLPISLCKKGQRRKGSSSAFLDNRH